MKISVPTKRIMLAIGVVAVIIMAVGAALYRNISALHFAIGVAMTSALNVLKMFMIERSVHKAVDYDDGAAGKNYLRFQYLIRFFITAAVLLVAALTKLYSMLYGAIFGVFTMQIAAVLIGALKLDKSEQ